MMTDMFNGVGTSTPSAAENASEVVGSQRSPATNSALHGRSGRTFVKETVFMYWSRIRQKHGEMALSRPETRMEKQEWEAGGWMSLCAAAG